MDIDLALMVELAMTSMNVATIVLVAINFAITQLEDIHAIASRVLDLAITTEHVLV
jgi:hypothetical protein